MEKEGCTCDSCRGACEGKPGWFMPDQIKKLADHMQMTEKEVFKKYLAVDWLEEHPNNNYEEVFVIAPALNGEVPGDMYPGDPRGGCSLFNDKKLCDIHDAKPIGCSELKCGDEAEVCIMRQKNIATAWIDHQDYVEELLGEKPWATEYEGGGIFGMLGF